MTNQITLCAKVLAHHRGGGGGGSFSVSSVKLWNGLPDEIKRKNSLLSFKNTLKTYFINSYTDIDYFEIFILL